MNIYNEQIIDVVDIKLFKQINGAMIMQRSYEMNQKSSLHYKRVKLEHSLKECTLGKDLNCQKCTCNLTGRKI